MSSDIRELIDSAGEFTLVEAKELADLIRTTHSVKYVFSQIQHKITEVLVRFPNTPLDLGAMGKLQGEITALQNLLAFFVQIMEEAETPEENEDEEV